MTIGAAEGAWRALVRARASAAVAGASRAASTSTSGASARRDRPILPSPPGDDRPAGEGTGHALGGRRALPCVPCVLAVEGVQSLDVMGPVEIFYYANQHVPGSYRVDVVAPATDGEIRLSNGLR